MKGLSTLLIILFLSISYSSKAKDGNNVAPEVDDVMGREYLSFKTYRFDQFEDDYILELSGNFGMVNEENSKTDTVYYHNPSGGVYYTEFITRSFDELGRDTAVTWINNEGGSPNFQVKRKETFSYYMNSDTILRHRVYILGFTDLELFSEELNHFDEYGNQTLHLVQQFNPSTGEVYNATGDSVMIEYESTKSASSIAINPKILQQIVLSWAHEEQAWKYTKKFVYAWSNLLLVSIIESTLSSDGTVETPVNRYSEFTGFQSAILIPAFAILASVYIHEIYENSIWKRWEKVEINSDEANTISTITSRWMGDFFLYLARTEVENFYTRLYNNMKRILPQVDESYFKSILDYSYNSDEAQFFLYFGIQNILSKLIAQPPASLKGLKSEVVGDSILTLTRQIYDAGSGNWLDNYKQEFVFRNTITTGVDDMSNLDDNITIFPNPTDGMLNVKIDGIKNISRIEIVNTAGQIISTISSDNFSGNRLQQTDLKHLDKGVYFIKVFSENQIMSKKFILM